MTAFQRWCLVALGGLLLVGAGWVWSLDGVRGGVTSAEEDRSALEVVDDMTAAGAAPYSGYVETVGTLQIPVASRFTDVGRLFGERTSMRVWWRSESEWRVDKLLATGETDLIHRGEQTIEWSYDDGEATAYFDPDIRLPRTSDLLPPALGARALVDVQRDNLARIDDRMVAGRSALGVRISPASADSSIDHVDVFADVATGIPLRLEVYAEGERAPSFTSEFREFSSVEPPVESTIFTPPAGAKVSTEDVLDIADAANQFSDAVPPAALGGLAKTAQSRGAVGVYGTGLTQVIAVPLWDRAAEPLRKQLRLSPQARELSVGTALGIGPLNVLLTESRHGSGWLLAGTVALSTLESSAPVFDREWAGDHDHD